MLHSCCSHASVPFIGFCSSGFASEWGAYAFTKLLVTQCTEFTCNPLYIQFNSCSWQAVEMGFHSKPVSIAGLNDLLPFFQVQYTAEGFLEKNRDTLPASVRGLFINSITPLLSVLFKGKSFCYETISHESRMIFATAKCGTRHVCQEHVLQLAASGKLRKSRNEVGHGHSFQMLTENRMQ